MFPEPRWLLFLEQSIIYDAPFLAIFHDLIKLTLTGRTEPLRYAPQNNQHPTPEVTQAPQLTQHSSLIVFALPVFLIKWNKQYQSFSSQTGR
jgi:hypothetical protein